MTNQEIINVGQQIYDETNVGANTSERVGGVIKGIGQNLNELGNYTTNEEWIKVVTDADGRVLYGVKADGEFVFGVGVPQSIKDYVFSQKAKVDADVLAEKTRAIAAEGTKVDKVAGKGLSTNDYTNSDKEIVGTGEIVSNDEYIQVVTDVDGRVLEGVKPNGDKKVFGDVEAESFSTGVMNLGQESDDNYIIIVKDYFNRFLYGVKKDGNFDFAEGVPEPIRKYIEEKINTIKEDSISGVVARNRDKEASLYAACRYGTTSPSSMSKDFQICMVTDTHTAENEQSITNAVACTNGFRSIDALIHLGDIEMYAPRDTYNTPSYANGGLQRMISEKMAKCVKPWFVICGNHEVGASCTLIHYTRTHKEVYDDIIKPVIENGWLKDGEYNNTAANYADRCYYFHDFDKTKVRLICLYEYGYPLELRENSYWEPVTYDSTLGLIQPNTTYTYDANNPITLNCGGYTGHSFRLKATVKTTNMPHTNSGANGGTFPWYKARGARIFTKTQMDWLVATLNSTPAGYGVVIASHQPILRSVNLLDKKFSVGGSPYNTYNPRVNGPAIDDYMDKDIIADIVNAWQNKTANFSEKVGVRTDHTLVRNDADYLNTLVDGDYHYYYEVTANFSGRNNTAYFAGYISGHEHFDMVEQSKQYPTQFNVIPCCSGAAFRSGNDTANLVYDTDSVAYDNLTTFSCASGRIALARIGNTKTINGIDRDLEIININNN